jgi:hypothetical protein
MSLKTLQARGAGCGVVGWALFNTLKLQGDPTAIIEATFHTPGYLPSCTLQNSPSNPDYISKQNSQTDAASV